MANISEATLIFEYDPWRGGFCLRMGPFSRQRRVPVFGGLMSVYLDDQDRIAAVESFWDHGGLPLRGLHGAKSYPEGEFSIEEAELRVGPFRLRQSAEKVELWFGTEEELPRDHWSRRHDASTGVTVWCSPQKVQAGWPVPGVGGRADCPLLAGLEVELARTVAGYPIASVRLSAGDFK